MKITEILETSAEFIPHDPSTAAQIARQFLDNANGDVDLAKKMADAFSHKIKQAVDAHALGTGRPQRSTGYEQAQTAGTGRSRGYA